MVLSREEAAKRAEASKTNVPGTCQKWTHEIYGAPSAGDFDHDGDADAMDGWKSEPAAKRHADRNPPRGVPVAYSGGSHGYGHRAISLGNGKIRSTDAGGSGHVATVDLDWPEKHWGLKYVGWSETITGQVIPGTSTPTPAPKVTFGIDISNYQSGIDLAAVKKQGYEFVLIKCTQGTGYVSPSYGKQLAAAKKNGYLTVAYHFLEHGNADAQAANLAAHIIDKNVTVAIDVEPTGNSRPTAADWIAFRKACTKRGLDVTLKYLNESYWDTIGKPSLVGPLALWRPAYPSSRHDYGSRLYPGNNSSRWNKFGGQIPVLWQFASTGKIDGYAGNVDVNAFRGTRAELAATGLFHDYAGAPPPPPPPPVTATTFVNAQFNSQHTDKPNRQMRDVLIASDVVGFNEVESLWQRLILKTSPKFGVYPTLGTAGFVPVCWRKSVFEKVDARTFKASDGREGVSPTRNIVEVDLRHKATGKIFTRRNTQVNPHIEVNGRTRTYTPAELPRYEGWLDIAKAHFQLIRKRMLLDLYPAVTGGDFNVDYLAERKLPVARRVSWFPLTLLGGIAGVEIHVPSSGTHGARGIDWTLIKGLKFVRQWKGEHADSDHDPIYTELELS